MNGVEIWKEFNPVEEPLNIQVIEEWSDDQGQYCSVFYTGRVIEGVPTRIFGYYGYPKTGERNFPGMLHIHGGGQTASMDHVKYWVKAGYGCLSYDWTGPEEGRNRVTDLGKAVLETENTVFSEKEMFNNRLYNAAVFARRGITFLSSKNEINENIGIYGISWGGTTAWIVNGSDKRVKACCPIYGCGGMFKPGHILQLDYTVPHENYELFFDTLSPEAYSRIQKSPVLVLQATNDFWGWIDHTISLFSRLNVEKRIAFTTGYNHHIDYNTGGNVLYWMDFHLKQVGGYLPEMPALKVISNGDILQLEILHDQRDKLVKVELNYSVGDYSEVLAPARFWRKFMVEESEGRWETVIKYASGYPVFVFCTVKYSCGYILSSLPIRVNPPEGLNLKSKFIRRIIDDFSGGIINWYNDLGVLSTDFIAPGAQFFKVNGPQGNVGISYRHLDTQLICSRFSFFSYQPSDIESKIYGRHQKLSFMFKGMKNTTLSVEVHCNHFRSHVLSWKKNCDFKLEEWGLIEIGISEMEPIAHMNALVDWSCIEAINITGNCEHIPEIAQVQWIE